MINSGLIVNQGFEFMLYSTPVQTKDFTFDLNINLSRNVSKVKEDVYKRQDLDYSLQRQTNSDMGIEVISDTEICGHKKLSLIHIEMCIRDRQTVASNRFRQK